MALRFTDILPHIDTSRPFAVLDRAGTHITVDNAVTLHNLPLEVINAEVIPKVGFGTFRYDRYAEEDFLAIKLNYSQSEVDNT